MFLTLTHQCGMKVVETQSFDKLKKNVLWIQFEFDGLPINIR